MHDVPLDDQEFNLNSQNLRKDTQKAKFLSKQMSLSDAVQPQIENLEEKSEETGMDEDEKGKAKDGIVSELKEYVSCSSFIIIYYILMALI